MMNNNNTPSLVAPRCDQLNSETGTLVKESAPAESLRSTVYSVSPNGEVQIHQVGRRMANIRSFALDYRAR